MNRKNKNEARRKAYEKTEYEIWLERTNNIFIAQRKWKKRWIHRKPCKEWSENRDCKHFTIARYKKFKNEIDSLFGFVLEKPIANNIY